MQQSRTKRSQKVLLVKFAALFFFLLASSFVTLLADEKMDCAERTPSEFKQFVTALKKAENASKSGDKNLENMHLQEAKSALAKLPRNTANGVLNRVSEGYNREYFFQNTWRKVFTAFRSLSGFGNLRQRRSLRTSLRGHNQP